MDMIWEFPKNQGPKYDPQFVEFLFTRTPINRTPNLWKQPYECNVILVVAPKDKPWLKSI